MSIRGFVADARREEDQKRLVESVAAEGGRLDVLVNNAGIGIFAPVDKLKPDDFRAVLETNLLGPYYAVHHAAPLMKKNGGGFIVNIASLAAVNAFAGGSAYNASKFGLLGFSEAAMLDLRHDGIRMATVLPGSVATDFGHSHGNRDQSWMLQGADVAEAVADLVRFPDRAIPSRVGSEAVAAAEEVTLCAEGALSSRGAAATRDPVSSGTDAAGVPSSARKPAGDRIPRWRSG